MKYNTQQPSLPFPASYHVRWRADRLYTNAQIYSGGTWVNAGWDFSGDVSQNGAYLEMRIPLSDIGSPSILSVHLNMISETLFNETSFAAVPSDSFFDGYDPDYTKYYQFDLKASTPPNDYFPQ
jgi:hypothetical protein